MGTFERLSSAPGNSETARAGRGAAAIVDRGPDPVEAPALSVADSRAWDQGRHPRAAAAFVESGAEASWPRANRSCGCGIPLDPFAARVDAQLGSADGSSKIANDRNHHRCR